MSNTIIKRMWALDLSEITSKGKKIESCWKVQEQDFKVSVLNKNVDISIVEKTEHLDKREKSLYYLQEKKQLIEINQKAYETLLKIAKTVSEYNDVKAILSNYPNRDFRDVLSDKSIEIKFKFTNILIRTDKLGGTVTAIVEFNNANDAKDFIEPKWFGKEITSENNWRVK